MIHKKVANEYLPYLRIPVQITVDLTANPLKNYIPVIFDNIKVSSIKMN